MNYIPVKLYDCMSLALFGFGGGEIILMFALIFILVGAKKLPGIAQDLRPGEKQRLGHPWLMALTFILGAGCLVLICHELSK